MINVLAWGVLVLSLLPAGDADLDTVLARAADYVVTYQREFSSAVGEERYEQTLVPSLRGPQGRRVAASPTQRSERP